MEKINNNKIGNAAKWSTLAELLAKIASPIVNMVLARILTPEAFGVVASITIITSFADIFTDAGFQKYIIQHEYSDDEQLEKGTNVAFWANFIVSSVIYILILSFRRQLARTVGCPDAYNALAVAGFAVICTSFSSTQTARFRRDLDFKPLFFVRIISAFIPLIVTVPIAFISRNYWAMVIGTLAQQIFSAIVLTLLSKWKPRFYFSLRLFREMFFFSIWNLLESLSIWFAGQAGIFIVGTILSQYELGLYKTAMTTVNSYMAIVTASVTPVLFSSLSRYQSDAEKYTALFLKFERVVAMLMFPMGIGMLLYRDFVVQILLGSQWSSIANFLGLWSLMSAITITFSNTACEVYRSKGKPQISLILELIYLSVYLPFIWNSAHISFSRLCLMSCLVRLFPVALDIITLGAKFKILPNSIFPNVFPAFTSTMIMSLVALTLRRFLVGYLGDFISILICVLVYFAVISRFTSVRNDIKDIPVLNKIFKN